MTKLTFLERLSVLLTGIVPFEELDQVECVSVSAPNHRGGTIPDAVVELRNAANGKIVSVMSWDAARHEWLPVSYVIPEESDQPLSEVLALLLTRQALTQKP